MIQHYIEAINRALAGIVSLLTLWAMPLTLSLGFLLIAGVLVLLFGRGKAEAEFVGWRQFSRYFFGYLAIGIFLVVGWAALRTTKMLAQQDIHWRERFESTLNPVPDSPPVSQTGPAVAAITNRTYSRSLTLPPSFLNRLGAEGVGVLAPYLSDPTSENVVKLRDSFRRQGRTAIFTRTTTVEEEEPVPFTDSKVKVAFQHLSGRAYDAAFEARYSFANSGSKARTMHFLFTLPDAGTIKNLKLMVGDKAVTEPIDADNPGTYEWRGILSAGESREATVTYHVIGARVWSYDLGSTRRRVQQFQLDAAAGSDVTFLRGSLQPTSQEGQNLSWQLSDVVTAQKAAIVFPPDDLDGKLYLQALSALPASFILFFVGALFCGMWLGETVDPRRLGTALVGFAFGLGSSSVMAIYLGPVLGLIVGPLVGAGLACAVLGRRYLLAALPVALLPVAFLSEQNSGLWIYGLSVATLGFVLWLCRPKRVA